MKPERSASAYKSASDEFFRPPQFSANLGKILDLGGLLVTYMLLAGFAEVGGTPATHKPSAKV
jgi:hypothetical protein